MIRREQLRLTATFRRLLLLSLAAPAGAATYACGSSSSDGAISQQDGGADATAGPDSMNGDDQGDDGGASDAMDADTGPICNPTQGQPYFNDASFVPDATADGAAAQCYYFVDVSCDSYQHPPDPQACYFFITGCADLCTYDGGAFDCFLWQDAGCNDGGIAEYPGQPITVACSICSSVGRRPAGLRRTARNRASTPLGRYFADTAHLEAASVHAFERLRDELLAHDAPAELVKTAERSILDEIRHARVTTRLARRFGSEPAAARVRRPRARSLETIARENATEGCVRETFGAMLATWQAANASDAKIRSAMRQIAHDETRHAALAWSVATWAEGRLDARARARIARARRKAVHDLGRNLAASLPASSLRVAGLPNERDARALFGELYRSIWR